MSDVSRARPRSKPPAPARRGDHRLARPVPKPQIRIQRDERDTFESYFRTGRLRPARRREVDRPDLPIPSQWNVARRRRHDFRYTGPDVYFRVFQSHGFRTGEQRRNYRAFARRRARQFEMRRFAGSQLRLPTGRPGHRVLPPAGGEWMVNNPARALLLMLGIAALPKPLNVGEDKEVADLASRVRREFRRGFTFPMDVPDDGGISLGRPDGGGSVVVVPSGPRVETRPGRGGFQIVIVPPTVAPAEPPLVPVNPPVPLPVPRVTVVEPARETEGVPFPLPERDLGPEYVPPVSLEADPSGDGDITINVRQRPLVRELPRSDRGRPPFFPVQREEHLRRRDTKGVSLRYYTAMLSLVRRTWGRVSEVLDFVDALNWNTYNVTTGRPLATYGWDGWRDWAMGRRDFYVDWEGFILDFAFAQLMDKIVGAGARQIQRALNASGWRFPVGFQMFESMVRGFDYDEGRLFDHYVDAVFKLGIPVREAMDAWQKEHYESRWRRRRAARQRQFEE